MSTEAHKIWSDDCFFFLLNDKVVAPSLSGADMTEKLKNLTSGEGSIMSEMISSGDAGGAANIVAACAGMLNIASSNAAASTATTIAATTAATGKIRDIEEFAVTPCNDFL